MTSNGYIPLVSIIMPAYNIERYIEKAIRSVINQTFTDWELIVIDDGSKDSTLDIIELMVAEDERISSMPNETNIGVAKTRNRGIDIARGKYIALLDSDDIWYENKLELQIKKLEAEKADICYCSYAIIDEEGKKIRNDYMVSEFVAYFKHMLRNVRFASDKIVQILVIMGGSLGPWLAINTIMFDEFFIIPFFVFMGMLQISKNNEEYVDIEVSE